MTAALAIVTGGSSGIGLALTKHLQSRGWKVAILDLQAPLSDLPSEHTLYIRTDVAKWEDNASAFAHAWQWAGQRLDFVALNAAIDERDDIFHSISRDANRPPTKPNMLTFEVDLFAPYYGLKLAAHYMSLNEVRGGKVIITSSAAGLRGAPVIPQYSSCKHGLVGLTRSLAPRAAEHSITVNAICPNIVATGLAPPGLMDGFKPEQITPMGTMMRAFDELATFDGVEHRKSWVEAGHNGQVVEVDLERLYYRQPVEDTESSSGGQSNDKASQQWANAYLERNRAFAVMDWSRKS